MHLLVIKAVNLQDPTTERNDIWKKTDNGKLLPQAYCKFNQL